MNEGPEKKDPTRQVHRRRLLTAMGGIFGSAPLIVPGAALLASEKKETDLRIVDHAERRRSIKTLETAEAVYKIEYTIHSKLSTPEVMEGADALIIEAVGDYSGGNAADIVVAEKGEGNPHSEVVKRAFYDQKPIFLVDTRAEWDPENKDIKEKLIIDLVESMVGGSLVARSLTTKEPTRREILKGASTGAAGAYLLSPSAEFFAARAATEFRRTSPDESSVARSIEKGLNSVNRVIHPESRSFTVEGRDALIAQKSQTVARMLSQELGRKPQIALEIGGGHLGIETEFRSVDADRVARIGRYLNKEEMERDALIARVQLDKSTDPYSIHVSFYNDPEMLRATKGQAGGLK